jgi:eukaryotic-like serine/threonine-protein kinase
VATQLDLVGVIGQGGFCIVHEARLLDGNGEQVGPTVAIKSLRQDMPMADDYLARFQREARLLDDVLDHPNIVPVITRNVTPPMPWFVMPKADGNLAEVIFGEDRPDEDWIIDAFRQILAGMAYAHDKDVIHRDLKPENALIYGEVVRISDFGLGKHLVHGTEGLTKTNQWSGTEPYMAPEQFNAMKETGPEADVFALGKLLMVMLTGEVPEVGARPDVSELPERFRYFVQRCCASQPANRFEDAREALEAFDRITGDPAPTETAEETLTRLGEKWWELPKGEDLPAVRDIDAHLRQNPDEEAMFTRAVPRLPEELLDQYQDELPDEFLQMLEMYDRHVSGGLPFEYCDVVTRFYERIFRRTKDPGLRELIIRRLYLMGAIHNRWYVRTRLLTLLAEFRDASTVALVDKVIREDDSGWMAEFVRQAASDFALPASVRHAIEETANQLPSI